LQGKSFRAAINPLQELQEGGNRAKVSTLLESMADSSIMDGTVASPETKGVLETILTSLTAIQNDDILASHLVDQTNLNDMITGFIDAATTLTAGQSTDGLKYEANIEVLRGAHSACRDEHKTANDEKVRSCTDLTNFISGVSTPNCAVPGRSGNQNDEYFTALESHIDTYKTNWANKEAACAMAESATWSTKNLVCNGKQAAFEAMVCSYRNQIHDTCSNYGTTYETKLIDFNSAVTSAVARADGRKVEWKAISKILCFIEVIKSDAAAADRSAQLATCKQDDASTDNLVLVRPTVPAKVLCSFAEVSPEPCSSDFEAKYYQGLYICAESQCQAHACSVCNTLPSETLRSYTAGDPACLTKEIALNGKTTSGCGSFLDGKTGRLRMGECKETTWDLHAGCMKGRSGEITVKYNRDEAAARDKTEEMRVLVDGQVVNTFYNDGEERTGTVAWPATATRLEVQQVSQTATSHWHMNIHGMLFVAA